jgi:hypothetical protein
MGDLDTIELSIETLLQFIIGVHCYINVASILLRTYSKLLRHVATNYTSDFATSDSAGR